MAKIFTDTLLKQAEALQQEVTEHVRVEADPRKAHDELIYPRQSRGFVYEPPKAV